MKETIEEVNRKYNELFPDDANIEAWSGCNYYVNFGNNEFEPIGTATSMHDCGGCQVIDTCQVKQKTRIWEYNEAINEDLTQKWDQMHRPNGSKRATILD